MTFTNVKGFLGDVDDPERKSQAELVFKLYEDYVVPKIPLLKKSIIHGDCNGMNIVVERQPTTDSYRVAGLIDFGDASKSCTIFEFGIGLAYVMLNNLKCSNVIDFVGPMIQGYHSILPLTGEEFDVLYYLVLARCVQNAVMGAQCFIAEPWNTYILVDIEKSWMLIDLLLSTKKEVVDRTWKTYMSS